MQSSGLAAEDCRNESGRKDREKDDRDKSEDNARNPESVRFLLIDKRADEGGDYRAYRAGNGEQNNRIDVLPHFGDKIVYRKERECECGGADYELAAQKRFFR